MAAAAFQVANLAFINHALTKEMHGAKRGIVFLALETVTVTPDNAKM